MVGTTLDEDIRQLREALSVRQEEETKKLLERHEAERAEATHGPGGKDTEKLAQRQALEVREQEKNHEEELARYIEERKEAERIRERLEEQRRQDRVREWQAEGPYVQKPDYADVEKAEAARNAYEQKEMHEAQEQAMKEALARVDKENLGVEEAAAKKEEMRKALEMKFQEEQERLERQQWERSQRLERLYER